jgi:6-pyruvoyltetrahydropterin/6-carboxytetrahydropterin synthase
MITATRTLSFCAAHRLVGHEGKCASIHGHNYDVVVHVRGLGGDLDSVGRVVDFSVIKQLLGGWLDEHWDHSLILNSHDTLLVQAVKGLKGFLPLRLFMFSGNATAESMSDYLLHKVCPSLFTHVGVEVFQIDIWETKSSFASAKLDEPFAAP